MDQTHKDNGRSSYVNLAATHMVIKATVTHTSHFVLSARLHGNYCWCDRKLNAEGGESWEDHACYLSAHLPHNHVKAMCISTTLGSCIPPFCPHFLTSRAWKYFPLWVSLVPSVSFSCAQSLCACLGLSMSVICPVMLPGLLCSTLRCSCPVRGDAWQARGKVQTPTAGTQCLSHSQTPLCSIPYLNSMLFNALKETQKKWLPALSRLRFPTLLWLDLSTVIIHAD